MGWSSSTLCRPALEKARGPWRIPKIFDLRADPFEAGEDSIKYNDWFVEHIPYQYAAQAVVQRWLDSFKEFAPRQKAASFTVDQIIEKLMPKS